MLFNEKPIRKSLKEFDVEELRLYLNHNEQIELKELAGICSEILRRLLVNGKINLEDLEIKE